MVANHDVIQGVNPRVVLIYYNFSGIRGRPYLRQNSAAAPPPPPNPSVIDTCTSREVTQLLGMAGQSAQLLAGRGEFEAWRTPGGHRRISRPSVERWRPKRGIPPAADRGTPHAPASPGCPSANEPTPRVLLIDKSLHDRNLVSLLLQFARMQFIVVASLGEEQRRPCAFAPAGVPLVHKRRRVADLPPLLRQCLQSAPPSTA